MSTTLSVSTIAYTQMGVELIVTGIITIGMHYGAGSNLQMASVIAVGTLTHIYQYPVWGGVFAILVGIVGIIVGSAIQRTTNSIKGVAFVGFIGFLTQFIAFCFACNSLSRSVTYIRTIGQIITAFNYAPIIYSIFYMIIFLANFAVCIRFMVMGRTIIKSTAIIVQPTSTTVIIQQQNTVAAVPQQPPGYTAVNMGGQPMQPAQPGYVSGVATK